MPQYFSFNPTQPITCAGKCDPTHGWTQPMSISDADTHTAVEAETPPIVTKLTKGTAKRPARPFWTDSMDSPDCLPILLSLPAFTF